MNYREYLPHPALRPYLRCYVVIEELHTPQTQEHRFLPERSPKLGFYHGVSFLGSLEGPLQPMPNGYLSGLSTQPLRAVSVGHTRALQVDCYPWGAVHLFGLERGLQDRAYSRDELGVAKVAQEVEGLLSLGEYQGAIGVLEAWLLRRAQVVDPEPSPAIRAASQLYATQGLGKIGEIAEALELSVRQLERGFQKDVGIAPKLLAKLIRFEEAQNRIWLDPNRSLTELAFDLGYADQAHFTREFKALAHISPSEFARYTRSRATYPPLQITTLERLNRGLEGIA